MTTKEQLRQIIEALPEEVSVDEAIRRLVILATIEPAPGTGRDQLVEAIGHLDIAERLLIVCDVWDSIRSACADVPLSTEQVAELERREQQHRKHPDAAIPWEQARENLRKAL